VLELVVVEASSHAQSSRAEVLGCPLDCVSMAETVQLVARAVEGGRPFVHTSLNAAKVLAARRNDDLLRAIVRSDVITADGQGVVWAARALGHPVPERVTGIDLMEQLLARAAAEGWSVYVLGAREDVLEQAIAELRRLHPALVVAGRQHGYFSPADERAVVESIVAARPQLLFVALETPAKELFLERNRERLGPIFAMGVGGAVDVLAGRKRRAPRWVQQTGLEWLYRFAQDPRRLARRYLLGTAAFLGLVGRELVERRVRAACGTFR
jgi:N-acetylglucosaminyldiphosphoundecaprenol N-acetyl-beta-D-mannosaminyltransferase